LIARGYRASDVVSSVLVLDFVNLVDSGLPATPLPQDAIVTVIATMEVSEAVVAGPYLQVSTLDNLILIRKAMRRYVYLCLFPL
jgi:hypothetical protein